MVRCYGITYVRILSGQTGGDHSGWLSIIRCYLKFIMAQAYFIPIHLPNRVVWFKMSGDWYLSRVYQIIIGLGSRLLTQLRFSKDWEDPFNPKLPGLVPCMVITPYSREFTEQLGILHQVWILLLLLLLTTVIRRFQQLQPLPKSCLLCRFNDPFFPLSLSIVLR